MSQPYESDVSRPSALPTHKFLPRAPSKPTSGQVDESDEHSSQAYLDKVEREWCAKIDAEVEVLVEGMVDIVGLASVGDKDKYKIALEAFQAQTRAESMVRAADSLLSITHSIELMLLLSDEAQIARTREQELKTLREETSEAKEKVSSLLDGLLRPTKGSK